MGDSEKHHKAVFTLAQKLSPCVIFIDEIDSVLGRRSDHEHETSRKSKNEFMSMWDGLLSSGENERVLVLGATNRPFDLDDAVLRRMPNRILVDLPKKEYREKILEVILARETIDKELSLEHLAEKTEGFTGSDLKSLCVAAAFHRLREFIRTEEEMEKKRENKLVIDVLGLVTPAREEERGEFLQGGSIMRDSLGEEDLKEEEEEDGKRGRKEGEEGEGDGDEAEVELRGLNLGGFSKSFVGSEE